jgi:signal transduction histidine kinase
MSMEAIGRDPHEGSQAASPKLVRLVEHQGRSTRTARVELGELLPWASTARELRNTKREVQRLSAELLAIQESERKRIAADLHDGIGQSVSLLKLSVKAALEHLAAGDVDAVAATLAGLESRVQDTLLEIRRICMDLRPSMIDDLGILPTLAWLVREVEEAGNGLRVKTVLTVEESEVPERLKIVVFRIVQEAICNIAKHADASQIRLAFLRTEDGLRLVVEDDGRGFDPAAIEERVQQGRGLGVRGMMERVRLSGGACHVDSAPGKGTRVQVTWLLDAESEAGWQERAAAG